MGQIANQMALELFFRLREKIRDRQEEKRKAEQEEKKQQNESGEQQ